MRFFTYCSGYKCKVKDECLRNKKHKDLLKEGVDTRSLQYIDTELCVKYMHNNFIPKEKK